MPVRLVDGIYDHLLDDALQGLVSAAEREKVIDVAALDPDRTSSFMAAHFRPLLQRVLASVHGQDDAERQRRRTEILNQLLASLAAAAADHCRETPLGDGELTVRAARHLRAVHPRPKLGTTMPVLVPETPLSESALLVNAVGEPSLGHELQRELASADRVDLLCGLAPARWTG